MNFFLLLTHSRVSFSSLHSHSHKYYLLSQEFIYHCGHTDLPKTKTTLLDGWRIINIGLFHIFHFLCTMRFVIHHLPSFIRKTRVTPEWGKKNKVDMKFSLQSLFTKLNFTDEHLLIPWSSSSSTVINSCKSQQIFLAINFTFINYTWRAAML